MTREEEVECAFKDLKKQVAEQMQMILKHNKSSQENLAFDANKCPSEISRINTCDKNLCLRFIAEMSVAGNFKVQITFIPNA